MAASREAIKGEDRRRAKGLASEKRKGSLLGSEISIEHKLQSCTLSSRNIQYTTRSRT
uniref:Uncharacterized protein n=1 Tax=Arundo donax TaxID=35708 RepID=A0A0A9FER4_ARUDO